MKFHIYGRESYMENTDPQRRCYNGCNFKEEKRRSEWHLLGLCQNKKEADESVASWYRVGRKTSEFKAVAEGELP